jgi:alpha-galactosidase
VQLGARELHAATVVAMESSQGESPFAFLKRFCGSLCDSPRLPRDPVVGNNNWYYAYGTDFDAQTMLRDAEFLAELAGSHPVRPFCVIDAGWTAGGGCPGGPWTHGLPDKFPDMPGLAAAMKKLNVRPGIWVRPTALSFVDDPRRLLAAPLRGSPEKPLDLTLPDNIATMKQDIARLCSWGYELIKHDFSTWDALGRWGFEMGPELTLGEWHWQDQTLTNAQVLLNWYTAMREAAGDAYLLGCNTIGHLAAGLFEIQRTGDDTSGRTWERTRKMGINTLAFRLPQHQAFFVADADCTAHTAKTPWEMDRQWLELVARSGTALFISVNPIGITAEKKAAFGRAVKLALDGGEPAGIEPLDWLFNTCPRRWRLGDRTQTFDWIEPSGAWPFQALA